MKIKQNHRFASAPIRKPDIIAGKGSAFGTFGELLQGVLPINRNFLVTCPIEIYSSAWYIRTHPHATLQVTPTHKSKALTMAKLICEYLQYPLSGHLIISSAIPEGKGLASSSADLVATAKAVQDALQIKLPNSLIQYFLSLIEPSDGVMYTECVSFYQKEVIPRNILGPLPTLQILAVDQGGEVDTIEFNKQNQTFTVKEKYEYARLLTQLEQAIRQQDRLTIGQIATRSAILNQRIKPDKWLDEILMINEAIGGLGIIATHSGTHLGILLNPNTSFFLQQSKQGVILLKNLCATVKIYKTL